MKLSTALAIIHQLEGIHLPTTAESDLLKEARETVGRKVEIALEKKEDELYKAQMYAPVKENAEGKWVGPPHGPHVFVKEKP